MISEPRGKLEKGHLVAHKKRIISIMGPKIGPSLSSTSDKLYTDLSLTQSFAEEK